MKHKTFPTLTASMLAVFLSLGQAHAQAVADDVGRISGAWLTEDKDAVVEIYPCSGKVCGRFHWLKDDSAENPSLDDQNHDPKLRLRPLCGLTFLEGFEPNGNKEFINGNIYSPRDGNTYSGMLTLRNDQTLELRGYLFIPLLGDSQQWTRTTNPPSCVG